MEAPAQAQSALTQHVREAVRSGQARFLRPLPAAQSLRLDIVLPLRNQEELDRFLKDLYDPSSPSYRHFLTPAEFTAQFGPSQEDYEAATRYAASNGFRVVGGSRDGMDLQIEGPVSAVEAAFNVRMGLYQHPTEDRTFYAADREPTAGLPFPLWHISGLDNYSIPRPLLTHRAAAAATSNATTGSGPSSSFLGSDMRAAYYGGTALTGAGQTAGLLEYLGYDAADLNTYFTNANQTNNVPVVGVSTDGTSLKCLYANGCDDTEQILDITQAVSMAPGLAALYVYVGSSDTAIFGAMSTASPLSAQLSSSWTWSPADPSTDNPFFQKFAAQGQNLFQASGDGSTWKSSAWPSDAAYVVSVGGTDLQTSGPGGSWSSETAWADSGGGISPDHVAIPAWQQLAGVINSKNKGSTTLRNGPDVAANANFTFYVCADQTACTANEYGGTSFAAPMWAGYMALVNQQAVANGHAALGFIDPPLYSLGVGAGYSGDLHDITSGVSGSYSAVTGYDLVTGWGSPNGPGLIDALAGMPTSANFTISGSPNSVSVVQGGNGASTITASVSGGFWAVLNLSASGMPAGVTAAFSPASIAAPGSGSSTLTLTAAPTTATGAYTITVTGTGGGITHTATVALTVTAAPAFAISASPTSLSVVQGAKGTSTITTAVSGGFNSAVALSASGLPANVTAAFSPASIAAPGSGSSTLTLTAGSTAAAGPYTITVTGTGGGITHTATVALTVTAAPAFAMSASPTSVSIVQGAKGTSTITTTVSGGFNSAVALSASGLPTGATAAFSPASIAAPGSGTSTLTLTAGSSTAAGVYTVTVTGTGGGVTKTATVSLTVMAPAFTITASPTAASVARGSKGTSTIATAVSGGFNSAVALSATGQPAGVTVSFNPTSIAAPGSGASTMTMTVAPNTATGAYTITVTGAGGGLTHTASVTLTVR
jgi:uncharacterized membrane protein